MTPQAILALSLRIAAAEDRNERSALAAAVGALLLRLIGVRIRARAFDPPLIEDPSTGKHHTFQRHSDGSATIGELLAIFDEAKAPEGGGDA